MSSCIFFNDCQSITVSIKCSAFLKWEGEDDIQTSYCLECGEQIGGDYNTLLSMNRRNRRVEDLARANRVSWDDDDSD